LTTGHGIRGAKQGANDARWTATLGTATRLSSHVNGISGDARLFAATARACFAGSVSSWILERSAASCAYRRAKGATVCLGVRQRSFESLLDRSGGPVCLVILDIRAVGAYPA